MNKVYTKKMIKEHILSNGGKYVIFEKRNLRLNENEYVTGNDTSSVASNLSKAFGTGEEAATFDGSSLTDNSNDDDLNLNVTGNNTTQIAQNAKKEMNNLSKKGIKANDVTFTARNVAKPMQNSSVEAKPTIDEIRRDSIPFTKKELMNILF